MPGSGCRPSPEGAGYEHNRRHRSANFAGRQPLTRRIAPRRKVAVPLNVTILRSGVPDAVPGRSLDVGEGGIGAVLAAELFPGELVGVEFRLPDAGPGVGQSEGVLPGKTSLRTAVFVDSRRTKRNAGSVGAAMFRGALRNPSCTQRPTSLRQACAVA